MNFEITGTHLSNELSSEEMIKRGNKMIYAKTSNVKISFGNLRRWCVILRPFFGNVLILKMLDSVVKLKKSLWLLPVDLIGLSGIFVRIINNVFRWKTEVTGNTLSNCNKRKVYSYCRKADYRARCELKRRRWLKKRRSIRKADYRARCELKLSSEVEVRAMP